MSKETSDEVASLASKILSTSVGKPTNLVEYTKAAKRVAASCLAQREPDPFDLNEWTYIGPATIHEYDIQYNAYEKTIDGKKRIILIEA